MDTALFLSTFLADKPHDAYALIWTFADKQSHWYRDVTAIARDVPQWAGDVYIGMGLSPKDFGATDRCKEADIMGIMGLWADLDIGSIGHKKGNLPQTWDEAASLLDAIPLAPTMLVASGGGIHVYWLFTEPWIFTIDEDRAAAKKLETALTYALRDRAQTQGWDVDSTQDLARVLRLPGTYNHKHTPPALCELRLCEPARRYTRDEVRAAIPEAVQVKAKKKATREKNSTASVPSFNPNAQPPIEKLEKLQENPKFKRTWNRQRHDLQDQSASSYCQCVAVFAVQAGWTDQEAINLIITWRRKHGEPAKDAAWYARQINDAHAKISETSAKANEKTEQAHRQAEIHEILDGYDADEELTDDRRAEIIDMLSRLFHIEITRITKYRLDPPLYRLELEHETIILGDVTKLITQSAFRAKMAAAAGHLIPKFSSLQWEKAATMLLHACTDERIDEATDAGQVSEWLDQYLEQRTICEDANEAAPKRQPFTHNDGLYFYLDDFITWLRLKSMSLIETKDLAVKLKIGGCANETLNVAINGKRTTRYCWKIPPALQEKVTP